MTSSPAVRRKLADVVLDRLLAMIEQREIEPGGLMPSERELMRRFDVGRPSVREALQALEKLGLVQIRHGGRARLAPMEPRRLLEQLDLSVRHLLLSEPQNQKYLREARLLFESGMVRIAASRASEEDVAALREALERQEAARGDPAGFIQSDIAFHARIARISGNPLFSAISEAMLAWLFELSPRLLRAPNTEQLTLQEHREILDAIAARDPDGAVFALRAHLTRTNPLYGETRASGQRRRAPSQGGGPEREW